MFSILANPIDWYLVFFHKKLWSFEVIHNFNYILYIIACVSNRFYTIDAYSYFGRHIELFCNNLVSEMNISLYVKENDRREGRASFLNGLICI